MGFVLSGASGMFQRMMYTVLIPVTGKCALVHIGDSIEKKQVIPKINRIGDIVAERSRGRVNITSPGM